MSYVNLENITLQEIPKISDPDGRGNLSVIEKDVLPFKIKRVYYLYVKCQSPACQNGAMIIFKTRVSTVFDIHPRVSKSVRNADE